MSRQLQTTDKKRLVSAAEIAHKKQAAGDSPTEALFKTAQELGLQPGEIRALAHSTNTGAQLEQMDTNKTATARFASFALCDPEEVIERMRAGHKLAFETEVDKRNPLDVVRAARPATKTAHTNVKVAFEQAPAYVAVGVTKVSNPRQAMYQAKTAYQQSRADLGLEIKKLAKLLISHAESGQLGSLKHAAETTLGESVTAVMVRTASKEAGWSERHTERCFSPATSPSLIPADHPVLTQMQVCKEAICKSAVLLAEANRQTRLCSTPKAASYRPTLGKIGGVTDVALGNMLASSFYGPTSSRPTPGQLVQKKQDELDDPIQDQKLRNIRTQAMLSQLLTNPNDALGGTHPLVATEAFNTLSSLAPRSAQQSAIAGPWIRRQIEGKIEPFEAKAVVDAEKVLKQNTSAVPGSSSSME